MRAGLTGGRRTHRSPGPCLPPAAAPGAGTVAGGSGQLLNAASKEALGGSKS